MKKVLIGPFKVTPDQKKWLQEEAEKSGEPSSCVIRSILQAKVEGK